MLQTISRRIAIQVAMKYFDIEMETPWQVHEFMHHYRYIGPDRDSFHHISKRGELLLASEMTTDHLVNTLKLWEDGLVEGYRLIGNMSREEVEQNLPILRDELYKRAGCTTKIVFVNGKHITGYMNYSFDFWGRNPDSWTLCHPKNIQEVVTEAQTLIQKGETLCLTDI